MSTRIFLGRQQSHNSNMQFVLPGILQPAYVTFVKLSRILNTTKIQTQIHEIWGMNVHT